MKKLTLVLAIGFLTLSTFGQLTQLRKPSNHNDGFYYNEDKSISLNEKYDVHPHEFQKLVDILKIADELHDYCMENAITSIKKELGQFGDCKITFVFSPNVPIADTYLMIDNGSKSHYFRGLMAMRFNNEDNSDDHNYVEYVSTLRDKYYSDLKDYEDRLLANTTKVNSDIDKIMGK